MKKTRLLGVVCVWCLLAPNLVNAASMMYGIDFLTTSLFTIDLSTAATSTIGSASPFRNGLAFDSDGTLYSDESSIFGTVDPLTASPVLISNSTGRDLMSLDFNNDFSTLYGVEFNSGNLYTIDKATGTTILVGATGITKPSTIAINSANEAFVTETFGVGTLYRIDLNTGAILATVGSVGEGMTAMAFDDNDMLYGVGLNSNNLYSIDTTTSNGTVIGQLPFADVRGLSFQSSAVPIPPSAWLFGSGLLGLIGIARRRKT